MKLFPSQNQAYSPRIQISTGKFLLGVLLGLLYAFTMYALFYMTREVFRYFSVSSNYDLWVLTDQEVWFYNLFIAYTSVIFGQSICIVNWLDRPRRRFGKWNYKFTTIINDQRVLNWNFLGWFAKVGLAYGLMFGMALPYAYLEFSFYPDYNYIFILIILVLFLQSWNTIRLVFKRKSFKWMLISAVVVSAISFGFAQINIIDYKKLNESILSKNIYNKYKLEIPESDYYHFATKRRSLIQEFYFVLPQEIHETNDPILVFRDQEITYDTLTRFICAENLARDPADIKFMKYIIFVHNDIRMRYVNKLRSEFARAGVLYLTYGINAVGDEAYRKRNLSLSFPLNLPLWIQGSIKQSDVYNKINAGTNIIEIKQDGNDNILINNENIDIDDLNSYLTEILLTNTQSIIVLYVNDNISFRQYFNVLDCIVGVRRTIRDIYSLNQYSIEYEELDWDDRKAINNEHPMRIIEITSDMLE